MKISIITVCYNAQATISDTIFSVCSQDYPDVQYIIIDGASSDGTVRIIQEHPFFSKIAFFQSQPDRGIYDAMNKGIAQADGDVIGILNADDVYADSTVLSQVAKAFSDLAIEACYADLVYTKKDNLQKVIRYWKSRPFELGLFEKGWMPAHPTFFVRKKIYELYGLFDLEFSRQADYELTLRFLQIQGITSLYVPKIWVYMRVGGQSNKNIKQILLGNLEAYKICKLYNMKVSWMPIYILKKIISKLPQFFYKP